MKNMLKTNSDKRHISILHGEFGSQQSFSMHHSLREKEKNTKYCVFICIHSMVIDMFVKMISFYNENVKQWKYFALTLFHSWEKPTTHSQKSITMLHSIQKKVWQVFVSLSFHQNFALFLLYDFFLCLTFSLEFTHCHRIFFHTILLLWFI